MSMSEKICFVYSLGRCDVPKVKNYMACFFNMVAWTRSVSSLNVRIPTSMKKIRKGDGTLLGV